MKKPIVVTIMGLIVILGVWAVFFRGAGGSNEIEYKYAKVELGELIRSTSANGQVVALTTVDVKSKAGGKVLKLYVEEGSVVKKGDLIAEIDPSDTKSNFDQANADLTAAIAQSQQANVNVQLQERTAATSKRDAQIALDLAKIRLEKARETAKAQPELTKAAITTAQANFDAQTDATRVLEQVTIPQKRSDVQGNVDKTKSDMEAAKAEAQRQKELLDKGYVSQSSYEKAQAAFETSKASYQAAVQRMSTLEAEIKGDLESQKSKLEQSKAALSQAKANATQDFQSKKAVEEADRTVKQAEVALEKAKDELLNVQIRQADVKSADAAVLRNRIKTENADVNYKDATVRAPRDGIVTLKYLEEGTIIPPGTSTFSQGTSLVQISDVTTMYVECAVDEADIASVKKGQNVRITAEAFPGLPFKGVVERVSPAATTTNNVTTIKVRVQVLGIDESATKRGSKGRRGQGAGQGQTQTQAAPPAATGSQAPANGPRPGGNTTSRSGGLRQDQPPKPPDTQTPPGPDTGRRRGGPGQGGPGQGHRRREDAGAPGAEQPPQTAPQDQPRTEPTQGKEGRRKGQEPGKTEQPPALGTTQPPQPEQPKDAVLPVRPHPGNMQIVPGMNATVEFLTLEKKDVLICPQQAIKNDAQGTYVLIKTKDPLKPQRRAVKVGDSGNDGVEILDGLKPEEEVVVAEINLAEMRDTQKRMQEAAQGGGLAGGTGPRPGGNRGTTTTGGGARPSGGGGR